MEGVSIAEAAVRLGISEGAVRKRIKRGLVDAHKGEDGRWYIVLDRAGQGQTTGVDRGQTAGTAGELEAARSEVAFLRDQVKALTEALSQEREITARALAMAQRQLAAPGQPQQQETPPAVVVAHQPEASPSSRPWWKFWRG